MTNNPTIDGVSRWLIEQSATFLEAHSSGPSIESNLATDLRALLDREVITDDHLRQRIAFLTKEIHAQSDAIAALQSTIAQLRIDLGNQTELTKQADYHASQRGKVIAQLQARVQELESGRSEPVAWMCISRDGYAQRCTKTDPEGFPVYRAPPPPVAVVLPERLIYNAENLAGKNLSWTNGWNACLDATAALSGGK